jgi:hypothetical protein
VERVQHPGRIGQLGVQGGGIPAERIQSRDLDGVSPGLLPGGEPVRVHLPRPSGTTSSSRAGRPGVRSTMPVAYWVRRRGPACRHTCSSTPSAVAPSSRAGSLTSGPPYFSTARHTLDTQAAPPDPPRAHHAPGAASRAGSRAPRIGGSQSPSPSSRPALELAADLTRAEHHEPGQPEQPSRGRIVKTRAGSVVVHLGLPLVRCLVATDPEAPGPSYGSGRRSCRIMVIHAWC